MDPETRSRVTREGLTAAAGLLLAFELATAIVACVAWSWLTSTEHWDVVIIVSLAAAGPTAVLWVTLPVAMVASAVVSGALLFRRERLPLALLLVAVTTLVGVGWTSFTVAFATRDDGSRAHAEARVSAEAIERERYAVLTERFRRPQRVVAVHQCGLVLEGDVRVQLLCTDEWRVAFVQFAEARLVGHEVTVVLDPDWFRQSYCCRAEGVELDQFRAGEVLFDGIPLSREGWKQVPP